MPELGNIYFLMSTCVWAAEVDGAGRRVPGATYLQ